MKIDSTDFENQFSTISMGLTNYVVNTFQALMNQIEKALETNKKLETQLKELVEENNSLKQKLEQSEPHSLKDK